MKKMINIVFILGALSLLYQFFVMFLMNKHDAVYSLKTSNNAYMIHENFEKERKYNMYYFLITDQNKKNFVYSIDRNLNRQSRIIKEIKTYQNNNLYCIAPVFKKKAIDSVLCKLGETQVSTTFLKQAGNNNVLNFTANLKKEGYTLNEELDKETPIKSSYGNGKKISIYDELDESLYLTLWGYNGVYILNNGEIEYRDFLRYDHYENDFARLVDKFYISINTDNTEYGSFYVVNIKDGGRARIDSDFTISKNSYFNGIYNKKLYYTDIDNRKQYILDPSDEELKEVSTNDKGKFFDGEKLVDIDMNELVSTKKYFNLPKVDEKLQQKYPDKQIFKTLKNKYFLDSDGSVYKIVGDYIDYKILLFKIDGFKEMKIVNDKVFGVSGDTVFYYSDKKGLRKAALNRELVYNYRNIFDVYEK